MQQGSDASTVRTVIFVTLLFSNIFLTLVNRSFVYSVFKTITYKNNLVPLIIGITLVFIAMLIYVPFVRDLFRLNTLPVTVIITCIVVALVSTLWIDLWKLLKTKKADSIN
jgi:Ca2+-transporting ATPase